MAKEIQSTGLAHNALSTDTTLVGDITSTKDIRIDGKIEGNISCSGKVIVGEMGQIVGNVTAENLEIMGQMKGDVCITDMLILKSNASFEGNITTGILSIEPHALFNGGCSVRNKKAEEVLSK